MEGESAWPELIPGKHYLATNLRNPKVGDFVVFRNPLREAQILVKKIEAKEKRGYRVKGMLPWATSSKELGVIPASHALGTIVR
ncbi:MAG: hypothetical protein HY435_00125 [Candidatus Liptonbacteria bacterium]|nr:hypothetical protein [Candidatus Liptonbacteria bacterium]